MKEPVDHILRPRLPWRDADAPAITECGQDASKGKTITRHQFFDRQKNLGKQRAAMLTCMTCSGTVQRWGTWDDDPRLAIGREVEWERSGPYYARGEAVARNERGQRLRDELLAIAALIETHREEFDALIAELEQRREWLEKKAAMKARPAHGPRNIL
jgi:hypothetical protein